MIKNTSILSIALSILFVFSLFPTPVFANDNVTDKRMQLFKNMEVVYHIPWYYIAAIDQYERNIQSSRKANKKEGLIAIHFSKEKWAGILHPDPDDQNPGRIQFFNGLGLDGDGDGNADRNNDLDVLNAFLTHLSRYGIGEHDIHTGLTEYYNSEKTADIISEVASIFKHFNTLDQSARIFPIPRGYNYSYRSTWGDTRGWGGVRIHEGTDIFASYGTPVRSVSNGYVEILGWNRYGGWRIGIRGASNIYYYYAHLSSYKKGLQEGNLVKAGDIIGYVGSSGYGPPGTQGKFPPHLHFGTYSYNGKYEWAFDPTPFLRLWERKRR